VTQVGGAAAIRGDIANWVAVHHQILAAWKCPALSPVAHLARMIFHPFLAAHASAKMLFT